MVDQRDDLLATVASLYYRLNQSQTEIAARLDISSSTVSRLIREARERGIVEIHIHMPIPRALELEQTLIQRFGLKDAYVLQSSDESSGETLLEAIGKLAATHICRMLHTYPARTAIGVAWGTGVHAAVSAIPDGYARDIDVVQLLGGVGALVIDSPDLGRIVAQKLGGRHYDLHAPVLVERALARDIIQNESVVGDAIMRAKSVRLAITGIGTLHEEASSFLRAGLVSRTDLAHLRSEGIVGEMCGRFFDIDGNYERFDINQRIIGIDLNDLRGIPQSLAVARGATKAKSILGALRGHFVKVLATDDVTARAILKAADENDGAPPGPDSERA